MNYILLDTDFQRMAEIDTYDSMIWTERHREHGDFEMYGRPALILSEGVSSGRYLMKPGSDVTMIIEDTSIETDVDEGARVTVVGRSLESILYRRVVYPALTLEGDLEGCVQQMLNETFISPANPKRKISNMVFEKSNDPYIESLELSVQFSGEYVYDAIVAICEVYDLGFKMVLRDGKFVFRLTKGTDRSMNQSENPYVIFSPDFDNIADTNYAHTVSTAKTVAYVAGEEKDETPRMVTEVDLGLAGLDRIEMFVDASDLRTDKDDGTVMSEDEYSAVLEERGLEQLAVNSSTEYFEGSMDTTGVYVYGRDFFLGDTVQISNEYGISASSQVLEIVYTKDESGETVIPTFSSPVLM